MLQDLRFALRALWKEKSFTVVVVLTLALAMGASSTIYTMMRFSLLRSLPFADPESVAVLWSTNHELGRVESPWSIPDFVDLKEQASSFDDMTALTEATFNLSGVDEPIRIRGLRATANFFPLMGLELAMGRGFLLDEERPNAPRVAVLSHGGWNRRFGADPNILGREILLNEESFTVVGVLTPELEVGYFMNIEVWTPLSLDADRGPRDQRHLGVWTRLSSTATSDEAQAGTMQEILYDDFATSYALFSLLSYFSLVALGLATAGIYGVVSYAVSQRSHEIGLRMALGAGTMDVLIMLLRQGLAPVALGVVLGFSGALALSNGLASLFYGITSTDPATFLTVTVLLASLAFLAVIGPALRAARCDPTTTLRHE